jgi:3-isopropylmalate/(R)-2-methylmalate dehydratase small subunit
MTTPVSRIERIRGTAIVLPGDDVDTDRIIPARFLRAITFEGLEAHVFADDRAEASRQGRTHPFDDARAARAAVLFTGSNFGCGSSREHAPRALAQRGIRAIVGVSFAEIFFSNALSIGLPCLSVAAPDLGRLTAAVFADPAIDVVADVASGEVVAGAVRARGSLPESARSALLSGEWHATALLLDRYEDVERVRDRLPYLDLNGF